MPTQTDSTMAQPGESVWTAAMAAQPDARIRVDYDSSRSDEEQTAEGRIERVAGRYGDGVMSIVFRRDDGQYMAVESDGAVLSIGSHYPRTGTVIDVTVVAECPDCGEETFLNDDGEAVYCGLCGEERLTNGYRSHPFKATDGVSG